MRNDFYPACTVASLLKSGEVTPQTKAVLNERINKQQRITAVFFDDEAFALLEAVSAVLFPQDDNEQQIPLAILFEDGLVNGKGKGWRHDNMPPLKAAVIKGFKGIEEEAQQIFKTSFVQLSLSQKEHLLTAIQKGNVGSSAWQDLPSKLFFEELLAMLTETYYSHPIAKDDIGDASFADAKGWTQLGLNNREAREPQSIKPPADATF